ncbi:MAG: aminoglycoside N-acetyltransferase AAC(6')-Ii [Anaerolineae bacterium]
MHIQTLGTEHDTLIQQTAALLMEAFREHWPSAWPDMSSAVEEVRELTAPEHICRVALKDDQVIGLIAGQPQYNGKVWELHPLAVCQAHQSKGVGSFLVADFEMRVRERGGLTVMLGSDDETDMTSLSGLNLYPNVWHHVQRIANYKRHPYTFYQKLGYSIVGVIPDANGFGKPDILMAKRISHP